MDRLLITRAAAVLAGVLAAGAMVGGCGSDDHHDRYRSSRDYDYGSRPAEYRPDPMPGYNARQVRNERRDAERYDRSYDDR